MNRITLVTALRSDEDVVGELRYAVEELFHRRQVYDSRDETAALPWIGVVSKNTMTDFARKLTTQIRLLTSEMLCITS